MDSILAYAAGIIDGEGCITVGRQLIHKNRPMHSVRVCVGMNHPGAVEFLHNVFGGYMGIYKLPSGKDHYRWSIPCQAARIFLIDILPYLRVKKEQAELAIKLEESKLQTHGKREPGKCYLSDDTIKYRDYLKSRISLLNADNFIKQKKNLTTS